MIATSRVTVDTLVTLASWAVLIGGLWLTVRAGRRGRRRRDQQLWRQWNQVRDRAQLAPGHGYAALGQVRRHRQRARRGLKAYVFWPATGELGAAWFWHRWPPVGAYVVARGSWGVGEHQETLDQTDGFRRRCQAAWSSSTESSRRWRLLGGRPSRLPSEWALVRAEQTAAGPRRRWPVQIQRGAWRTGLLPWVRASKRTWGHGCIGGRAGSSVGDAGHAFPVQAFALAAAP